MDREKPKRILVVDDEPTIAEMLSRLLRLDGWEVHTAGDGVEALLAIERDAYDVVLSDVTMPRLDGFGLYREVRARRPELSQRMAFITARDEAVNALRAAGVPVLPKPFDPTELRRIVRELSESSGAEQLGPSA